MPDSHEHDLDAVSARVSHTFSPMLSLHGYLGCLLTQYTPLPDGLDATFAIGPLPNEPAMVEARVSLRQQPAVAVRLCRDGAEVVTLSVDVTLASLENDVDPMVELTATVLGTLIHQLPGDERAQALAHVRAAYPKGLGSTTGSPWPTLQ